MGNQLESKGFTKTVIHYNNIIYACSSRQLYAKKHYSSLMKWRQVIFHLILKHLLGSLKQHQNLGDVAKANNIISEMRMIGNFTLNEHICSCLLKTYAEGCRQP